MNQRAPVHLISNLELGLQGKEAKLFIQELQQATLRVALRRDRSQSLHHDVVHPISHSIVHVMLELGGRRHALAPVEEVPRNEPRYGGIFGRAITLCKALAPSPLGRLRGGGAHNGANILARVESWESGVGWGGQHSARCT